MSNLVIDCHAHLDERALSLEDQIQKMDEEGINKTALIARITETLEPDKSEFLLGVQRQMMNSNILRKIASLVSLTFYDSKGVLRPIWSYFTDDKKGYTKTIIPDNQSVALALEKYPERFLGWIFINPKVHSTPEDEIEKWRKTKGMIGIKVHPYWHQFPLRDLESTARRSEELNLPLLIHMGFGDQGDFKWLVETFPRLKIIFAHAGLPYYKSIWPLIQRHKYAYVDLSSAHLSENFTKKVVSILGAEKCLFGTESPYGITGKDGKYDYGHIKGWVDRLDISEEDREKILGKNFLEFIENAFL